jgi:hypothetical protein
MMMQHQDFYRHPSSSFDESSIDEPQAPTFRRDYARGDPTLSSEDDEFSSEDDKVHDNLRSLVPTNSSNHQARHDDRFKMDSNPAQGRKRCAAEELDSLESSILCPSKKANVGGSHVVKGGQKLIGELFDPKNEDAMNSILRKAYREGLMKTLAYPNRTEWVKTKLPIWFGSGGILAG